MGLLPFLLEKAGSEQFPRRHIGGFLGDTQKMKEKKKVAEEGGIFEKPEDGWSFILLYGKNRCKNLECKKKHFEPLLVYAKKRENAPWEGAPPQRGKGEKRDLTSPLS